MKYGDASSRKHSDIEDGVDLIPVEGDPPCTSEKSSNHIRKKRDRHRVDEKDYERGYVQRVVTVGLEVDNSLKKSTRDTTVRGGEEDGDGDGDGGGVSNPSGQLQLVVESEGRSKKKPITAYFNPFGAWNEKDTKSSSSLPTSPAVKSSKKAVKARIPTPISTPYQTPAASSGVRRVKRFFSDDRMEHEVGDAATLSATEGGLVGTGDKNSAQTRKKKDLHRLDDKDSERGYVQRVVKGSDENFSPWFSLKKSTRDSTQYDDEEDGDEADYGLQDIYPSGQEVVVEMDRHIKKKPIVAYLNPFGAWSEKDVKSPASLPTSPVVSSSTKASFAVDAQNSEQVVRTLKQPITRNRNDEEKQEDGTAAGVDSSEMDRSHIRKKKDRHRVDEKDYERGYVQRVVTGGLEIDSQWFSLKKSTRDTTVRGGEEDGDGDGGEVSNPSGQLQLVVESEGRSKKKPITAYFNPFGAWNEKDTKSSSSLPMSPAVSSPKKAVKAQMPTPKGQDIEKWASGVHRVKQSLPDDRDKRGKADRDVTAGPVEEALVEQSEKDPQHHIRQKRDLHRVAKKEYEQGYVHMVVNGGEEDDNPWFSLKKSPRERAVCGDEEEEEGDGGGGGGGGEVNILAGQQFPSGKAVAESETQVKKKPITAYFNPLGAWNERDMKSSSNSVSKTKTSTGPPASSPKEIATARTPAAKAKDTVKWASEVHTVKDPISDDDGEELPASVTRNRHSRRYSIPNNFKQLQDKGVDARHIKRNASSSSFIL